MGTETLLCECGIYICGKSVEVVKSNLEQHMKTEKHTKQLARKRVSKLVLVGGNIEIDEDGDYYVDEGYQGKQVDELRKKLAIINYDKNQGFSEQVIALAELNKMAKEKKE